MKLCPSVLWVMINLQVSREICLDPRGLVLDRQRFITVMDLILKISTEEVNLVFAVGTTSLYSPAISVHTSKH